MQSYELSGLCDEVRKLRTMLLVLSRERDAVQRQGLMSVIGGLDLPELLFTTVPEKLLRAIKHAETRNPPIADALKEDLKASGFENGLVQLGIIIDIERGKPSKPITFWRRALRKLRTNPLYRADNPGSIPTLLFATSKLLPALNALHTIEFNRTLDDDSIFHPSRIDADTVTALIDSAIRIIEESGEISELHKVALVRYLKNAISEVKSDRPSWKSIIGAMVVTATILQGIASAPEAVHNLHEALRYITGTASEQSANFFLTNPPSPPSPTPPTTKVEVWPHTASNTEE